MNELLPCPFCGGSAVVTHPRPPQLYRCSTDGCPASWLKTEAEAWNRRPTPPSPADMPQRAVEQPVWIESKTCIRPTHEAADAFWKYWRENGETHKHGFYESTWGAINAALNSTGQLQPIADRGAEVEKVIEGLREIESFLDGSGTMQGCALDERPVGAKGNYWWRKSLHERVDAVVALLRQPKVLSEEERDALRDGADLLSNEAAQERERSGRYPVETEYFVKYDRRARLAASQADILRRLAGEDAK